MKTRTNFVSNSSSSSFLLNIPTEELASENKFHNYLFDKECKTKIFDNYGFKASAKEISNVLFSILKKKKPASKKEILVFLKYCYNFSTHHGLDFSFMTGDSLFIQDLIYKCDIKSKILLLAKNLIEYKLAEGALSKEFDNNNIQISDFIHNHKFDKLINEIVEPIYQELLSINKWAESKTYILDIGFGGGADLDSDLGGLIENNYKDIFNLKRYLVSRNH